MRLVSSGGSARQVDEAVGSSQEGCLGAASHAGQRSLPGATASCSPLYRPRLDGLGLYWHAARWVCATALAGVESRVERPVSRWFEICGREHLDRHARSRVECG
jgi:hypothetical protein